eukprot:s4635_g5.t1
MFFQTPVEEVGLAGQAVALAMFASETAEPRLTLLTSNIVTDVAKSTSNPSNSLVGIMVQLDDSESWVKTQSCLRKTLDLIFQASGRANESLDLDAGTTNSLCGTMGKGQSILQMFRDRPDVGMLGRSLPDGKRSASADREVKEVWKLLEMTSKVNSATLSTFDASAYWARGNLSVWSSLVKFSPRLLANMGQVNVGCQNKRPCQPSPGSDARTQSVLRQNKSCVAIPEAGALEPAALLPGSQGTLPLRSPMLSPCLGVRVAVPERPVPHKAPVIGASFVAKAPQPLPVSASCWGVPRLASTVPTLVASPIHCYRQSGLPSRLTVPAGPAVPAVPAVPAGGVISKANAISPCTKLETRTSGDSKQTDAAEPIKEWAYLSDEEMILYAKRQLGSLISHTLLAKLSRRELVALLSRERHASSPQTVVRSKGVGSRASMTSFASEAKLQDAEEALALAKAEALALFSLPRSRCSRILSSPSSPGVSRAELRTADWEMEQMPEEETSVETVDLGAEVPLCPEDQELSYLFEVSQVSQKVPTFQVRQTPPAPKPGHRTVDTVDTSQAERSCISPNRQESRQSPPSKLHSRNSPQAPQRRSEQTSGGRKNRESKNLEPHQPCWFLNPLHSQGVLCSKCYWAYERF